MVPELRVRHRRIWYGLAIVLPLAFAIGVLSIPSTVSQQDTDTNLPKAMPVILKTVTTNEFTVNLRSDGSSQQFPQQLEIITRVPLTAPAALVYLNSRPGQKVESGIFLGLLGSGEYHRYPLTSSSLQMNPLYLILYDQIKQQSLQNIKL